MTHLTPFEQFRIRLTGILYGIAYFTTQHSFLGLRLSGWIKFLLLIFIIWAWFQAGSRFWLVTGILLLIGVQIFYWLVKRRGYIRFIPVKKQPTPSVDEALPDNRKVKALATGVFSVSRLQTYALQKPASYWRVPVGDHAFMVEHEPEKFVYQFVQAGSLVATEVGFLVFGHQPQEALAVTFLTSWGPEFGDTSPRQLMAGENQEPVKLERTIYLTFDDTADRHLVHHNLLRDIEEPVEEPL